MDYIKKFKNLLHDTVIQDLTIYGIKKVKSASKKFLGFEVYPTKEIRFEYEENGDKVSITYSIKELKQDVPAVDTLYSEKFRTEDRSSYYPYCPEAL